MRKSLLLLALLLLAPGMLLFAEGAQEVAATEEYIELTKAFYYRDATEHLDRKDAFMEAFEEQFGVRLVVNTFPRDQFMEKLNLAITSRQLQGLVLPFSQGDMLRYREDGAILPLDGMLAGNRTWDQQPAELRDMYKFYGGTWGIATGQRTVSFARLARKDWLENLGMDYPETIDELYEMARAFTEDDPDGNGQDDTVGMVAAGTWNLQDIFYAFDAPLNGFGGDPITWDENEQAFVDSFLKPEAAEALAFIAELYQNGYLDQETFTNNSSAMREKLWSGKYGSTFYWMHWGRQEWTPTLEQRGLPGEHAILPWVTGNRTEHVYFAWGTTGGPWCMLANTDNAKAMVNTFVDTFLGDEMAYLWGAYGIRGQDWRLDSEGRILVRVEPTTGQANVIPGITAGRMIEWPPTKYPDFPDGTPEEINQLERQIGAEQAIIDRGLAEGTLWRSTPAKDTFVSTKYTEIIGDLRKIFEETVIKAVTGEMSPEAALDQYRSQVKALGAQQALQQCNDNYGSTLPAWSVY